MINTIINKLIKIIIVLLSVNYNTLAFEIANFKKYEDTTGQITLQNIIKEQYSSIKKFKYNTKPLVLNTQATYWLYLEIKNLKKEQLIISTIFMIYDVDYYFLTPEGKIISNYKAGFNIPIDQSVFRSNDHAVPVPTDKKIICIIKLKSTVKTGITIQIDKIEDFIKKNYLSQGINWTLFGFFTFACLYAIIFLLTTYKKIYLFYLMYICSFWLCMVSINHSTYMFFSWLELPFYNRYISVPHYINTISLIWYAQQILDSKKIYPYLYKSNIIITLLFTIQLLVSLLFDKNLNDYLLTIIFLAPSLFLAIKLAFQKNYTTLYIIIGILLNIMAFTSLELNIAASVPSILLFGIYGILDIILFGLSISLWLKNISKENEYIIFQSLRQAKENQLLKEEQNISLEKQVLEKTKALNNANKQLNIYLEQIAEMNNHLENENVNLKINVETQTKARSENKLLNFKEFADFYPESSKCFEHIAEMKWANGYSCTKCDGTKATDVIEEGRLMYKRCNKCRYPETVTAKTLFHKNKIDILKAFYICYVTNSKKQMTIEALSEEIVLRKATTFNFILKVKKAMILSKKSKLHKDGWSHLIMSVDA